jgi:CRP-like cAMP-binding protein
MDVRDAVGQKEAAHGAPMSAPLEHMLALNEVPLFRGLSKRHLRRFARLLQIKHYRSSPVVRAGARGDSFHVILDGRAEVQPLQGHNVVLQPGDSFGELALLDGAPRDATVSAVGELTTASIQRPAFLELLRKEPAVGLGLAQELVAIIRDLQGQEGRPGTERQLDRLLDTAPSGTDAAIEGRTSLGWLSALAQVPLFRELSGRHLSRVVRLAELRRYGSGVAVVRAGAPGDAFHILLDGRAQVRPAKGRELILEPGDFFGELALLDGARRAATVVAIGDLTTARIARADFLKLLKGEPQVVMGLLRGLVRIVRALEPPGRPA